MASYELQNIKPFNNTYFINCYFSSFLTAVKHFNGSIFSYLSNYSFAYRLKKTSNGLSLNLESPHALSFSHMNNVNKIRTEMRDGYCKDIVNIIINSILKGSLILLPIDGFYYKHRFHDLFYLREHHKQIILIYGFDSDRQVFKTVEANGFEWDTKKCCYKDEISFQNLVKCHEGIVDNVTEESTLTILSKDDPDHIANDDPQYYRSTMINNLRLHKNDILKGIEDISKVAKNIEQIDIEKSALFDNKVASLSNKYKIEKIFNDKNKYQTILDNIIENWISIELIIYKNEFQGVISKERISSRLHQLYKLESMLYESLFSEIENV